MAEQKDKEQEKLFEMDVADVIIDRRYGFAVGEEHFFLYPLTLGKAYLVKRVIDGLHINNENIRLSPMVEMLRLVRDKRDDCALLIAYHTLQKKDEVLDSRKVISRREFLSDNLKDDDMAALLLMCLTADKTEAIEKHLKIDREAERMKRVMAVKKDSTTYQFGGVSIYGTLIDAACERYGWTYDYAVWGISYANLQLMLRDSVKTVYLSEKEAKHCHVPRKGVIDGNDAAMLERVRKGQSWR